MAFVSLGAYQVEASLASLTSANGTERTAGTPFSTNKAQPGSIVARCTCSITTASVVATFKPQVSSDGTTWYDLKLSNNASNVSSAAGTGSAATSRFALDCSAASSFQFFRCNATLSGAATAGADVTQVDIAYLRFDELE